LPWVDCQTLVLLRYYRYSYLLSIHFVAIELSYHGKEHNDIFSITLEVWQAAVY
jgi:hypothetical protein